MNGRATPHPLASTLFALLLAAIDRVRAVFRRRVVDPLLDPRTGMTKARFRRMMETLFASEARVRREIYETALKLIGAEQDRLPLDSFRLPRPATPAEIGRRFMAHARMSAHADWYAWRLARRLRKLLLAARSPFRLATQSRSTSAALQAVENSAREGSSSTATRGTWIARVCAEVGGGLQPRAPPRALFSEIAA